MKKGRPVGEGLTRQIAGFCRLDAAQSVGMVEVIHGEN